ncbi:winged helix-turn-helix domain-containing protein [Micromonospora sp. CPCC 205371]|nr:winged helix-turn-helix domain-containing protein [Micromonospora sp. CPCC 205371]
MIQPGQPRITGYRELAAHLRAQITAGQLRPGDRLPPEVALQQTYDLSRHTVRHAIAVLRAEGVVRIVRGWGTVVAESGPMEDVNVEAGSTVTARMPTDMERAEHDIPEGVPVFVVTTSDNLGDLYPADRYRLRIAD